MGMMQHTGADHTGRMAEGHENPFYFPYNKYCEYFPMSVSSLFLFFLF